MAVTRSVPDIEEIMLGRSLIFKKYESGMVKLTDFTPPGVINIYRMCLPTINKENSKRGLKPKLTFLDHVFCYLYLLKSGQTMACFSVNIGESESTLHSTIGRIRPILAESLKSNTFIELPAPNLLSIGLICDCSIFQVCNNDEIKEYLNKTDEDIEREIQDKYEDVDIDDKFCRDYDSFCVLGDSAYICSEDIQNKIGYKILVVPKYKSKDEKVYNREKYLASRRVYVEQFFGRLVSSWNIFRHIYRFEHKIFQHDIENTVNLTNMLVWMMMSLLMNQNYYTCH
ncbi:hypothetical protein ACTFIW_003647 [Dictyostelium discoideum]